VLYKPEVARELAAELLQIKALQVNVQQPFTWASGLKSPIYCDNRLVLSYPALRKKIRFWLCDVIHDNFPHAAQVAAVATGAIPHGMAVANQLDLPFLYVRPKPKEHGLGKQIEGRLMAEPTVVIEDLISTGMSSLSAVQALRNGGAPVLGLAAIFSYDLKQAQEAFAGAECAYYVLSNFDTLADQLRLSGALNTADRDALLSWRAEFV
jgi:orotate phosphoribosyltransferase